MVIKIWFETSESGFNLSTILILGIFLNLLTISFLFLFFFELLSPEISSTNKDGIGESFQNGFHYSTWNYSTNLRNYDY